MDLFLYNEGAICNEANEGELLMNPYISKLKSFLSENEPDYGNAESLLEMIYFHYTEFNSIDSESIREKFKKLRSLFPNLTLRDFDEIFDLVCDLCYEHEKRAFLQGVQVGVTLATELSI